MLGRTGTFQSRISSWRCAYLTESDAMKASTLHCGLTVALVMASSGAALADKPKAGDFDPQATAKEYPAPLSQTTQPSYVPQSVALSGPEQLDYEEGDPVPAGYTPVKRTRKGPIIAGSIVFGTLYFFSAMAAAVSADASGRDKNDLAPLWVPGVGPFITMGTTDSATGRFFLAVDGLGQCAGIALLVYGLTSPKTVLRRNDFTSPAATIRAVPILSAAATGVGLVGTF